MKQLAGPLKSVNVTGMFMGVYLSDNQPVLFQLEGAFFLPIFSTPEKYEEAIAFACLKSPAKIQRITDHDDFIDSVEGKVLMLDPWVTDRGTTRFTELRP